MGCGRSLLGPRTSESASDNRDASGTLRFESSESLEKRRQFHESRAESFWYQGQALEDVHAEEAGKEELDALLDEAAKGTPDAEVYAQTLKLVHEMLASGVGGVIIVVMHADVFQDQLLCDPLDDGLHTNAIRALVRDIIKDEKVFKILLNSLTGHNDSDRWEIQELQDLVEALTKGCPDKTNEQWSELLKVIGKLENQPKDGAMLMSHSGSIKAAAMHLKYMSKKFRLVKPNGKAAGTRHASSLAMAEWLGFAKKPGVVFSRSDGGGGTCFLPGKRKPRAIHFQTLMIPDQKMVLGVFEEKIKTRGELMRKVLAQLARPARLHERVVTFSNGSVTADRQVTEEGCMVIRATTAEHELYLLEGKKFADNYVLPGVELDEADPEVREKVWLPSQEKQLMQRGYKVYHPEPSQTRWVYYVTKEDMEQLPTPCFITGFGQRQTLQEGFPIAMKTNAEGKGVEIYCHHPDASAALAPVKSDDCLTMEDMLVKFKKKIMNKGELMLKTKPQMIRLGKKGEVITTIVNGRVLSQTHVADETTRVVMGNSAQDMYVLPEKKFQLFWEPEGRDIEVNSPQDELMKVQHWRWHTPKPRLRWVYKMEEADLEGKGVIKFEAAFGIQALRLGDYIGMPHPEASEVYLMPADVLAAYVNFRESEGSMHLL